MAKPKQLLIRVTNKMSQSGVGNLQQLLKLSRVLIVSFPQDFHKTVSNADSIPAFSFHHLTFCRNSILTSSTSCQRTLKYWRRLSCSSFSGISKQNNSPFKVSHQILFHRFGPKSCFFPQLFWTINRLLFVQKHHFYTHWSIVGLSWSIFSPLFIRFKLYRNNIWRAP